MSEDKDTNAERALRLLKERGALRTRGIADALGLPIADVGNYMRKLEETGAVVSCEVQVPGTRPQREWRLSAGGKPRGEYGRTRRPARAMPATSVAAEADEKPARETRTGGAPLARCFVAPDAADKPARKSRTPRKPMKPASPRQHGANRAKAAVKPLRASKVQRKTAKTPRIIPGNIPGPADASALKQFRCGIFSDGSLELVLGNGERAELTPADTRVLFDYLDKTLQVAA